LVLVNAHHVQSIQLELSRRYKLCNYCTSRHLTIGKDRWRAAKADDDKCDICSGLMKRLDFIIKIMKEKVADVYEFDTFLIGATLPANVYEREDQIRARLKIRGKENIKNQFCSELRRKFELITKKKVDYLLPDMLISVTVGEERRVDIIPKARSLTLAGRYIKKQRGLPQKQSKCTQCKGRGCRSCDNSGLSGYESVEGIIGYQLMCLTRSTATRFSWVGSEDRNSLVSGNGRPFFVTLFNPKVRMLKNSLIIDTPEISANVGAKPICVPQSPIRFVTKTMIIVESANSINENKLKDLNLLNNATIKFQNKKKTIMKKIYSVKTRMIKHNRFLLTLLADGGLAIKNFVSGQQYTSPNVSAIVGDKCESILFDVSDVHLR
jgi:tRNA pseudouridine synthase 10